MMTGSLGRVEPPARGDRGQVHTGSRSGRPLPETFLPGLVPPLAHLSNVEKFLLPIGVAGWRLKWFPPVCPVRGRDEDGPMPGLLELEQ